MTDNNTLPAPMLPEGVLPHDFNLQNFPTMPFDVTAFRDAAIQVKVSAEGLVGGVNLWCASWHQVPAGSLPDDPAELANLAGYGKRPSSLRAFQAPSTLDPSKTIMEEALYGFVKCSDGRLWHPTVAKHAREAYGYKVKARERTARATESRQERAKAKTGKPEERHDNHDAHDACDDTNAVIEGRNDGRNDKPMTDSVMATGESKGVMTTETRADARVSRNVDRDVNVTFTNGTERNRSERKEKEESPQTPQGGMDGELFSLGGHPEVKAQKPEMTWDDCTAEDWFRTFKMQFPSRVVHGRDTHTWTGLRGGRSKFLNAVKTGKVDPRIIVSAANRYAVEMQVAGNTGDRAQFVMGVTRWLNERQWEKYNNVHPFPGAQSGSPEAGASESVEEIKRRRASMGYIDV